MNFTRLIKHLLYMPWRVQRAFPPATLAAIGESIHQAEQRHGGEIRFAVEAALEPWALIRGQTSRERAIDVFSKLRVWDTQHNNGVLIYVLLAEHAVEIVADRGIHELAGAPIWNRICRQIEAQFVQGKCQSGVQAGVSEVSRILGRYFPYQGQGLNELPDEPVLL